MRTTRYDSTIAMDGRRSERNVNPGAFVEELGVGLVVADVGIPISTGGNAYLNTYLPYNIDNE